MLNTGQMQMSYMRRLTATTADSGRGNEGKGCAVADNENLMTKQKDRAASCSFFFFSCLMSVAIAAQTTT